MSDTPAPRDAREKLRRSIEQAKAKLAAIDARESDKRRKAETRGAIVFSGFAVKVAPELLDRAIEDLESRVNTTREKLDLEALKAFRARRSE